MIGRPVVLSLAAHGGAAALAFWIGSGTAGPRAAEAPDAAPVRFSVEAPGERPAFGASAPALRPIDTNEPPLEAPLREPLVASVEEPAPPPPSGPAFRGREPDRARPTTERLPAPASAPADESTVEPRRRSDNEPPPYPEAARRRGVEGLVVLRVRVSREGRALDVSVERGSGHALLDGAALEAVRGWTFEPALRGGAPSEGETRVSLRFRLTGP